MINSSMSVLILRTDALEDVFHLARPNLLFKAVDEAQYNSLHKEV